jgi:methylenetetrahydrofolate--tRNA-(uracil-5-)-methyltransferase
LCGVEGYVESIATGLLAGLNAFLLCSSREPVVPPEHTACGSLLRYITRADPQHFQPANISFGLLPAASEELNKKVRDRRARHLLLAKQACEILERWIERSETAPVEVE